MVTMFEARMKPLQTKPLNIEKVLFSPVKVLKGTDLRHCRDAGLTWLCYLNAGTQRRYFMSFWVRRIRYS